MVFGLGAAWILDGLQITISSSVTGVLTKPSTLDMTSSEIGLIASIYLVGEVFGALEDVTEPLTAVPAEAAKPLATA
jgi:hypothetical protein